MKNNADIWSSGLRAKRPKLEEHNKNKKVRKAIFQQINYDIRNQRLFKIKLNIFPISK